MRPRTILRRILPRNSQNQAFFRTFAYNTPVRFRIAARPQLPFLSIPVTGRQSQRVRYLTTERRSWFKHEVRQGLKLGVFFYAAGMCFLATTWALEQESLERDYPSPHEWGYMTRIYFRNARQQRNTTDRAPDWVKVMEFAEKAVQRLEDSSIEGKGVRDAGHDCPPGTKDVSAMSEPWRRGYFESMMLYAATAQQLDGWMRDKTRNIMFPPDVIIGPSHPKPKPVPPGAASAPREEDCEFVYPSVDDLYVRIIATPGFTTRQRMDAALAYASWLEFNGLHGPASITYERAVELALEGKDSPVTDLPIDQKSYALKESLGTPSENLFTSLTAFATFQARSGNVSSALPILVSILKARKSLPFPDTPLLQAPAKKASLTRSLINLLRPPSYPPPPPDGTAPPVRDSRELCEEAALHLHIGEILYTSRQASRDEGLAWTRDAVDLAEEQLHKMESDAAEVLRPAKKACRDCLAAGLDNWTRMVARLAKDERAKKETGVVQSPGGSWLRLWGEGALVRQDMDRWAAEEKVIEERQRRAAELLEELEPPKKLFGLMSIFKV